MDLAKFRRDFPILKQKMNGYPLIYFDSAATAQKSQIVIDCMNDFYSNHYATVHRAIYTLSNEATEKCNNVRSFVQKFLNAKYSHEIIFTRGTTDAINLVASSFGKAFVNSGDEILISQIEHHSNIVPWQIMCSDRNARLRVIPVDDNGEVVLEEYRKLLSEKTKLVSIAHVANSIGTVLPIKKMIKMAHEVGAKVLVDGAQSVPHMKIDVRDLDADFFAFSAHKVYGPTGIGILYGKEELLEVMPPYQGGGDMIEHVTFNNTTYNFLPLKFEAGTPSIAEIIGLGAALRYVCDIGLDNIYECGQKLLDYATVKLQEIDGLKIIGLAKHKGPIISFVINNIHSLDLGTMLDLKGVALRTGHLCAQPALARFNFSSLSRISFGLYNTIEEIDRFVEILTHLPESGWVI